MAHRHTGAKRCRGGSSGSDAALVYGAIRCLCFVGAAATWDPMTRLGEDLPCECQGLSSTPDIYQRGASSNLPPQAVTMKNISRDCPGSPWEKTSPPVENHWPKAGNHRGKKRRQENSYQEDGP